MRAAALVGFLLSEDPTACPVSRALSGHPPAQPRVLVGALGWCVSWFSAYFLSYMDIFHMLLKKTQNNERDGERIFT